MLWHRDLASRVIGIRRGDDVHLGFVEQLELRGVGLLGAGAEPLVKQQPQLFLQRRDLVIFDADQRLQLRDIVRQFGVGGCGIIIHNSDDH